MTWEKFVITTKTLHRRVTSGGLIAYARPHLRASVSLNLSLFVDGAAVPDTITVTATGLREPISPWDQQKAKVAALRARATHAQICAEEYARIATRHERRLAALKG